MKIVQNLPLIGRLKNRFWREERLARELPPWDATRLLLDQALGRSRRTKVRMGGESITVRSNTSDVRVAHSCLLGGEFNILSEHPDVHTVFHVGANTGTSAIAFARMFPEAIIVAVEPEEENFEILQQNVRDFPNIWPLRGALATSDQPMSLIDRGSGPWGYTLVSTHQDVCDTGQEINCFRITDLMEQLEISRVSILKLDIEGGERDILNDSSDWIDSVDTMMVELHDRFLPGCSEAFEKASSGFGHFDVSGEKRIASRIAV